MKDLVCHLDGTVSYWSIYERQYIDRVTVVPDREFAAMCQEERVKVMRSMFRRHFNKYRIHGMSCLHVYGCMPNADIAGWYFRGYTFDVYRELLSLP